MPGKLKNIEALQKMLAGEHRTQTKSSFFVDSDTWKAQQEASKITRKVGDRWIEEKADGTKIYFEQREGYRKRSDSDWDHQKRMEEAREREYKFLKCPKEKCTCVAPKPLDEKFRKKMDMCFDCVVEMETKMKINGTFNDYAKNKMRENAKAYFRDMEIELENWKKDIRSKMYFANGDSTIESWQSSNPEELIQKMESEFNELKELVFN